MQVLEDENEVAARPGSGAVAAQMNCAAGNTPPGAVALPVLAARLCAGAVAISAATAAWLLLVEEFDRRRGWAVPGVDSCAHWLSWQCGLSPGTAREHVRLARALPGLPEVASTFVAGRISYAKARAITRVADADTEQRLLELAEHCTAAQLERVLAGWRRADLQATSDAGEAADRAAAEARAEAVAAGAEDAEAVAAGHRASASSWAAWWPEGADPERTTRERPTERVDWHQNADGSVTIQLRLPPEDAAEVIAAVEHRAEVLTRRDRVARRRAEDTARADRPAESPDVAEEAVGWPDWVAGADVHQRGGRGRRREMARARQARVTVARCSAFLDLVRAGADVADHLPGDPARREVLVRVDATVLADDLAAGEAALACTGSLTAAQVRRLACDAAVTAVLVEGAEVLSCGRTRRYATRAQRRALLVRDGGCARPGCTETRPERLHAHHLRHWLHGGRTELANLVLLCDRDHGLVHDLDLVLSRVDGRLTGARPGGGSLWPACTPVPGGAAGAGSTVLGEAADLPPYWRANGERLRLSEVVGTLLAHRTVLRCGGTPAPTSPPTATAAGSAAAA